MKSTYLAAMCAAAILSGCQTSETNQASLQPTISVASCSEARMRIQPLAAENEAFNRQIVRASGRRAVRASVEADLPPKDAARRAEVIQELGALNAYVERNRCPSESPRRC